MTTPGREYLMAGQLSEVERLQLQSRVWEPAGRNLLAELGSGRGHRVLDVGCGVLSWLRVLSEWVGADGSVIGTDTDPALLAHAGRFVESERLANVELVEDDLFRSKLAPHDFDLVHARFEIAPLGRAGEQLAAFLRLLKPGGWIVLEDPDSGSWHFNPPARASERLIALIVDSFRAAGGDFDAGRWLPALLRDAGVETSVRAELVALPPGHAYLRLPLQFAASLEPRLLTLISADQLATLRQEAEAELAVLGRWGTTFTLVQAYGRAG